MRRCIELFADLEKALSKAPWLAGEEFSLADVSFAPYLIRLRMLGFSSIFGRHLRVADWADRVSNRPSVKEGVLRWISQAVTVLYERSRPDCERALTQIVAA